MEPQMESQYAVDYRIAILLVLSLAAVLFGLMFTYLNYWYHSDKRDATHGIVSLFHDGELSRYDLPGFYAGIPDGAMRDMGMADVKGCSSDGGAFLVKAFVWKNRGYVGLSLNCDSDLIQDGLTKVAPDAALYILPSDAYTLPDEDVIKGIEAGDYKPQTMAGLKTLPYDTGPVEIILNPQGVGGLDLKDSRSAGLPLSVP